MSASRSSCLNDQQFGPAVRGCRADFDFTQLFERTILWSTPSAIFILVASLRFLHITKKPRIVSALHLQIAKSVSIVFWLALQAALLGFSIGWLDNPVRSWTITGSVLAIIAGLFMLLTSFLDHGRSARPSALLGVYLLLTILFDAAQTRTLWNAGSDKPFAAIFSASLALKVIIFALELCSKSPWIDQFTKPFLPPEATSNIFGMAFYYWLRGLLWRGFKQNLALDDLYPLNRDVSVEKALPKLQAAIDSHAGGLKGANALVLCLLKAFPLEFLIPAIWRAAKVGLRYGQSFLMQSLLDYLGDNNGTDDENKGYGLIGAAALIYGGLAVAYAYRSYFISRLTSMTRAALCALVYRRVTQLGAAAASDAAPLTLMSTDINMVQNGLLQVHEVWGNTAEAAIGCWLLYEKIGPAFVVPVVVILVCLLPLGLVLTLLSKRQDQWMSKVQSRVSITSSVIASMKSFKMLGVAKRIGDLVQKLREDEVRAGNRFRVFQLLTFVIAQTPLAIAAPITFAFTSHKLGTTELFASLSYIILLASPLDSLIQSLPEIITAMVSLKRLQTFLAEDPQEKMKCSPVKSDPIDEQGGTSSPIPLLDMKATNQTPEAVFGVRNGAIGWDTDKPVLKDVSLTIFTNSLTIITGPVASGKSTLCSALLGQVPFYAGSVESGVARAPIGYCAPKPFLWYGTIRENIMGFSPFDDARYQMVLDATMLNVDIAALPLGSDTAVGSSGSSLSGGQRRRVALARALYAEAPIYILDDVLVGLDSKTENEVFERVLGRNGIIRQRKATAVLCTNAARYFSTADQVIVLNGHGGVAQQGPPEALNLQPSSDTISTHEDAESTARDSAAQTAKQQQKPEDLPATVKPRDRIDSSRQMGDKRVYRHYLRNMGGHLIVLLLAVSTLAGFATNFSTVWLNFWSADSFPLSRAQYLGVYGGIGGFELASVGAAAVVLLLFAVPRTGRRLHRDAINTVVSAPLGLFNHTDTGTITNLFSQDMSLVDMDLPLSLINFLVLLMTLFGSLAVVAVPSPYLAITYPFLFAALYALQFGYLRTSRQLRLLDLEAKSPLYNQFLETAEGITTIRSLGWVDKSIDRNTTLLNESQRPAYLLSMAQSFLTTMLNTIVAILAVIATVLATQLRTNSGLTGVSFITLLNLTGIIATMMQDYTELEISLGAVNRLATFSESTPPESNNDEDTLPDKEWPAHGAIRIENVSAAYKSWVTPFASDSGAHDSPLTLRNLSLQIQAGEHVAICGRTGSGKSSFLLLLLRLLDPEPTSHEIEIDGLSINQVDRETLRQRLIVIPQEPRFLPAGHTIKQNVDLFNEATDEECIEALRQTQLSVFLENGIHAQFTAETLSHGHQQMFGFVRAVLRKKVRARASNVSGGILIMDEPNSKVDVDTEAVMEALIRAEFSGYSVLLISHHLEMVMNLCSRVIILSKGEVVEQGSPRELADTEGTWFGALYDSMVK